MYFKYTISLFALLLVSSCGGGGGGGGGTPEPPAISPTINISADPTTALVNTTTTITWSSNNASACSANWTSSTSTSGTEEVTVSMTGTNTYSISCSNGGVSSSASVNVEGYRNTTGAVVDGYISNAEVFIDENENWSSDTNENSTTSDNDGTFTLRYANGNLVAIGGTDRDSQTILDNFLILHKLNGYEDFKVITPVTSVAAFMNNSTNINAALGIDSSINIETFDPVANKGDGNINDYLYEKGNQLTALAYAIQNLSNNINNTTDTSEDYFKGIGEELENEFDETNSKVDIETQVFIGKVLDNVLNTKNITLTEEIKTNTVSALASVMPIIEVKSSDSLTTSVISFALSTFQNDIKSIADGTANTELISSYKNDILNYIATDQSVDPNLITPTVTTINDDITLSEDSSIQIDVLANDSFVSSAPYTLSIGNTSNGSITLQNNTVTYAPDSDFNGTDSFSYSLAQSDQTSSADVSITISPVNDTPVINTASTISVEENQSAVRTISVSDVDEDNLTLSLGGTDADSFDLNETTYFLTFKQAPDYETKQSYSLTLSLTDGTETVTKDLTIIITNLNDVAPEFTSSTSFSADENQTSIGTVTASDVEGDDITFSVSGSDFTISADGVLSFNNAPDYETKTSYSAQITATDGVNSATQNITVNINNLNDNNPYFTSSSNFSADENQTSIGNVTSLDADGDSVTFTISGSELLISSGGVLSFNSSPDYETKTSYTETVTASDGERTSTQVVDVAVNNLNDNPPVYSAADSLNASENQTGAFTAAATDADGSSLTYSITGGTDQNAFSINSSSGVVTFNSAPDYETKNSYVVVITVNDGVYSITQQVDINITDVNEAPIFASSSTFNADENQTSVGSVSVSDPENATLSYSLSGTDASSATISSSGTISFNSAPNYEVKSSYDMTVSVSDGTNTTTQDITINIGDVNDVPVANAASFSLRLLPQSQTAGIYTLSASDEDGDSLTYSIVSNGTYGTASLSGATLTYTTSASTQSAQSESFTFKVNDGANDSPTVTVSFDLRSDPLYQYQWHLNNTGQTNFATNGGTAGADLNVDSVISSYTGNGVVVSVIDTGLELAHEDLAANILANKSYDYGTGDSDPTISTNEGDHGTSVAGIIASTGWNNKGGRGVAPDANLIGGNAIGPGISLNNTGWADAYGGNVSGGMDGTIIDIINASLGADSDDIDTFPSAVNSTEEGALSYATSSNRNGKGIIVVKSAGNSWSVYLDTDSDNKADTSFSCTPSGSSQGYNTSDFPCVHTFFDSVHSTPYIIDVASINADDVRSSYSNPGSSIWISGYGGEFGSTDPAIMTTDQSTCSKGYARTGVSGAFNSNSNSANPGCNYHSKFNGTSSAAPTISGVVALMLDANPNLTWRDVKHILLTTATQIDASNTYTYLGINQYSWIENAAGYKHHTSYGFGKVNAAAAVTSALNYQQGNLGDFINSGKVESGTLNNNFNSYTQTTYQGEGFGLNVTAPSGSAGKVEFVRVGIQLSHAEIEHIGLHLESPDGTTVPIFTPFSRKRTNPNGARFEIGVSSLYGENMAGEWKLLITDYTNDSVGGTLVGWDIQVYGR